MSAATERQAVLYRMVTDEHICPFGLKSRDLLEREGFEVDDRHLETRAETDAFQREHDVETTPQTFIGGERIGGYDDLRMYFGKEVGDGDETTYQPVIAVFATAFLMALAAQWAATGELLSIRSVEWFIAVSMCILAILKLRDLESFSNQFLGYDLLAQRIVRYAYFYPFGEAVAGICMIGGVLIPVAAPLALFIGTVVVAFSLVVGTMLGVLAGYFRGWLDRLIMRTMDVILAFPSILLALVLVTVLGPGLINAMIAIAVVYLPHFVRLARASVLSEKDKEYVIASRLAGAGHGRLMFNTILPNCMAPLIVQATLSFSSAILDAAALGFLGMGAQPPTPEWGAMLAEAREFILRAWWVVTFPGLAILLTVLAINLMGDGLRDALDPKLKRS